MIVSIWVATAIIVPCGCSQSAGTSDGQHRTVSANDPTAIDSPPDGQAGRVTEASSVVDSKAPQKQSGQSAEQSNNHDLAIVDESGNPLKHATVEPISMSINYEKFDTDENGYADIPWTPQPVKWVAITKSGYVDSGHIDVDQPKPIIITLKKPTD
jgi:hypothetical protein